MDPLQPSPFSAPISPSLYLQSGASTSSAQSREKPHPRQDCEHQAESSCPQSRSILMRRPRGSERQLFAARQETDSRDLFPRTRQARVQEIDDVNGYESFSVDAS